jgi:hypothetical protein
MLTPEYSIEPELQHSPRMIRRRGTRGYGTVFSQLIIIPLVVLTLFMLLWAMHMTVVRLAGPIVPCRITERSIKYDEHGKALRYLNFRYSLDGREYSERELVESATYNRITLPTSAQVQVSPLWPGHDSILLLPGRNVWANVWGLGITSLIMGAGVTAMSWYIFVIPARRRRLMLSGVPVRGHITDKEHFEGRRTQSFLLYYEYQTEAAPAPLLGRQSVRRSDFNAARVGDACTILYDRENPAFSLIYQYGDYEVI